MEIYSTEEQQAEAIKRFFRENGVSLALGIVLGLGDLMAGKPIMRIKSMWQTKHQMRSTRLLNLKTLWQRATRSLRITQAQITRY